MKRYTIKEVTTQFPDENSCLHFIVATRWPDSIFCTSCQKVTTPLIRNKKVFSCGMCGTSVITYL